MRREEHEGGARLGIAVSAALGLGVGVVVGLVAGELMGNVNPDRVRHAMRRVRRRTGEQAENPGAVEREILSILRSNAATRGLPLTVRSMAPGLVELTGTAPDEATREVAGRLARGVPGARTLVNRILVDGRDTQGDTGASSS